MPVKKMSDYAPVLKEVSSLVTDQLTKCNQVRGSSPFNCFVILIVVIFIGMVSVQVVASMDQEFTVTDKEAKVCLMDFQKKNCNALKLEGECKDIYDCIQRQSSEGMGTKAKLFMQISLNQLKENILIPALLVGLTFLYQIARVLRKKDRALKADD